MSSPLEQSDHLYSQSLISSLSPQLSIQIDLEELKMIFLFCKKYWELWKALFLFKINKQTTFLSHLCYKCELGYFGE